jgi:hypothetical protein
MFFRNFLRDYLDHYKAHPLSDEEPPDDVSDTRESDRNVNCFLAEIGVDALAERIQSLLEALPDWAMLMLRGHFCADDDVAVPMSKLCAGMSSYHYKAQKLGITLKKGSGDLQGFEHSLLGSWIGSLGVSIEPDNHDVIRFLLDAVCLEATARLEGDSA